MEGRGNGRVAMAGYLTHVWDNIVGNAWTCLRDFVFREQSLFCASESSQWNVNECIATCITGKCTICTESLG